MLKRTFWFNICQLKKIQTQLQYIYLDRNWTIIETLHASPILSGDELVHEKWILTVYASREGSDEPAQMRSVVRAFTARTHNVEKRVKVRANIRASIPTR